MVPSSAFYVVDAGTGVCGGKRQFPQCQRSEREIKSGQRKGRVGKGLLVIHGREHVYGHWSPPPSPAASSFPSCTLLASCPLQTGGPILSILPTDFFFFRSWPIKLALCERPFLIDMRFLCGMHTLWGLTVGLLLTIGQGRLGTGSVQ